MTWRKNAAIYENKPSWFVFGNLRHKPKAFKSGKKQMNRKKPPVHKFLVLQELGVTK